MSFLSIVSGLSVLIPLAAGLYLMRKTDRALQTLTGYLAVVLLVELFTFVLIFQGRERSWIIHFYTLFEYSAFALILSLWEEDRLRTYLRWSILGFAVIWIIAKIFIENFNEWDNYTSSLESILLIAISTYLLVRLSREEGFSFYKNPQFWVSCGILIYFAGNFMTFAFSNVIMNWYQEQQITWLPINSLLNILKNLCFTGGYLCLLPRYGGLSSLAQ